MWVPIVSLFLDRIISIYVGIKSVGETWRTPTVCEKLMTSGFQYLSVGCKIRDKMPVKGFWLHKIKR